MAVFQRMIGLSKFTRSSSYSFFSSNSFCSRRISQLVKPDRKGDFHVDKNALVGINIYRFVKEGSECCVQLRSLETEGIPVKYADTITSFLEQKENTFILGPTVEYLVAFVVILGAIPVLNTGVGLVLDGLKNDK